MRDKIDRQILESASKNTFCKSDLIDAVRKRVTRGSWTIDRRIFYLAGQGFLTLDRASEKGRTLVSITEKGKLALGRAAAQAEEA